MHITAERRTRGLGRRERRIGAKAFVQSGVISIVSLRLRCGTNRPARWPLRRPVFIVGGSCSDGRRREPRGFIDARAVQAFFGFDALGGSHHCAQNDVGPRAVLEAIEAERVRAVELAALARQPLAHCVGSEEGRINAGEDFLFFKAREQVGEQLRFKAQILALARVHFARGIEGDSDVVIAMEIEHDMAEQLEILANLAVAVDIVEARQDLNDRPLFGAAHLGQQRR